MQRLRSAMAAIGRWRRRDEEPSVLPRWLERVCQVVAVTSSVWFTLAVCWEMFGPFGAGHVAAAPSIAIAGENMWTWRIITPVLTYQFDAPTQGDFYIHHPWGIFWTEAILVKIFGHHDYVCRLPACFMSALTPPLLYAIGKRIWGPIEGAIACASFVVLPLALAFGNFNALEVPVIFGVLVSVWGYLNMQRRFRRRWLLVSVFGLTHAINSDWAAYFYAAPLLVFMLPRGILFNGRWYPPVDRRRFAEWWALAACACVGILLFYAWRVSSLHLLDHLLEQGQARSAGSALPLSKVLESRAHWIELSFTPLAIFLGKLALPLLVLRLIFFRRDLEIFPIAIWVMAFVQYVVFKQGADVHIFWPHYFAPYFALAMGCLAAVIQGFVRFIARRFRRQGLLVAPIVALALTLPVPLLILPDGIAGLKYARATGGRFDEKGYLIHQDLDKVAAVRWMSKHLDKGSTVQVHDGMKSSWHIDWALRKPITGAKISGTRVTGRNQYYLADRRFLLGPDLKALADSFQVTVIGPVVLCNRATKGAVSGYSLAEREPNWWEWYLLQGNDPIYAVTEDPFVTWELRNHLGQEPNPPPTATPNTLDQKRIAHNVALSSGDTALAQRLREELERDLDRSATMEYSGGTRLLGTSLTGGVLRKLHVVFEAGGAIDPDVTFEIESKVEEPKSWSLVPAPTRLRSVGMPFDVPTSLWRKGYLYASVSEIRPRPANSEAFYGEFRTRMGGPIPLPRGGTRTVKLLVVKR